MKLLDDFFYIDYLVGDAANEISCKVKFNPEHKIFEAHFPGSPITPGVCLVQMVTEILGRYFNKEFVLRKAVNIRFRKPVYPSETILFTLSKNDMVDGNSKVNVVIEGKGGVLGKMSLILFQTDEASD